MTILSPNVIIGSPSANINSSSLPHPPLSALSLDKPAATAIVPSDNGTNHMIGDQYIVLDTIGQGSFAEVREARHVKDAVAKFAVKIIKKPQLMSTPVHAETNSSKFVANPEAEAFCLKRAQGHPNIVRLHCISTSANHIFLVQDYLQGGDMFEEIIRVWKRKGSTARQGGFDELTAVKYFVQLLNAVDHLHSVGIAHRDIKTENIFLSIDKSTIQLGDFGFATCSPLCFTRCGTLDYVAPEVLLSKDTGLGFDPKKGDVWSCAVVLFAMLTARLPFDAHTKLDIMNKIKGRKFSFPSELVSKDAQQLLMSVFFSDATTRPSIADLKNHALVQKYKHHLTSTNLCSSVPSSVPSSLSPSLCAAFGGA
eukprot:c8303_g1_i1.p1 GENE.c8303_g1_i1~~c8303_g1_i1.p1  ORF type:complete len:367 (-),score=103.59 c8303_g1_i1:223-1323(-)